jgi:hypothetical protein
MAEVHMPLSAISSAIGLLIAAMSALAQVPGDSNGDGQLDAGDYPAWESCMLGPSIPASPECDWMNDGSGAATLLSMLQAQPGFSPPNPCTSDLLARQYAGATVGPPAAGSAYYGSRGLMGHGDDPTLCAEGSSSVVAFSDYWMTLVGATTTDGTPTLWAQFGVTKDRNSQVPGQGTGSTTTYYFEVKHGGVPPRTFSTSFVPAPPPVFFSINRFFVLEYSRPSGGEVRFD